MQDAYKQESLQNHQEPFNRHYKKFLILKIKSRKFFLVYAPWMGFRVLKIVLPTR